MQSCTVFVTTIAFWPTLQAHRDDAQHKGQIGRQKIFNGSSTASTTKPHDPRIDEITRKTTTTTAFTACSSSSALGVQTGALRSQHRLTVRRRRKHEDGMNAGRISNRYLAQVVLRFRQVVELGVRPVW